MSKQHRPGALVLLTALLLLAVPDLSAQSILYKEALVGRWQAVDTASELRVKLTDLYTGNRSLLQVHYMVTDEDGELTDADLPLFWSWQRRRWENERIAITGLDVHVVFTHLATGKRSILIPLPTDGEAMAKRR